MTSSRISGGTRSAKAFKVERLKGKFMGWSSRRITQEHRLVYRVVGKGEQRIIEIIQCKGHYN
jgi:toxin YoeB